MTGATRTRILGLLGGDRSYSDVAEIVGLSRSTVAGVAYRSNFKKAPPSDMPQRISAIATHRRGGGSKLSTSLKFFVTPDMQAQLRAEAKSSGRSVSKEIRIAIATWLGIEREDRR